MLPVLGEIKGPGSVATTPPLRGRGKRFTSWEHLAKAYKNGRVTVGGIASGEENRCAMALSAALGLRPRKPEEISLADIDESVIVGAHVDRKIRRVAEPFLDAEVLARYYVRARQLKTRLVEEWPFGAPPVVYHDSAEARREISGKRGIIFLEAAEANPTSPGSTWDPRRGDHIDIWDGNRMGSDYVYRPAIRIFFWEFPG